MKKLTQVSRREAYVDSEDARILEPSKEMQGVSPHEVAGYARTFKGRGPILTDADKSTRSPLRPGAGHRSRAPYKTRPRAYPHRRPQTPSPTPTTAQGPGHGWAPATASGYKTCPRAAPLPQTAE